MSEIATIGLDLAKTVFQVHGAGRLGQVMLRKRLRRDQVLSFFSALPRGGDGSVWWLSFLGSGDWPVGA